MVKIRFSIKPKWENNYITDDLEIDDSELKGMTDEERSEYIDDEVKEWAFNYIDIFWSEVKEVQNENNTNS